MQTTSKALGFRVGHTAMAHKKDRTKVLLTFHMLLDFESWHFCIVGTDCFVSFACPTEALDPKLSLSQSDSVNVSTACARSQKRANFKIRSLHAQRPPWTSSPAKTPNP